MVDLVHGILTDSRTEQPGTGAPWRQKGSWEYIWQRPKMLVFVISISQKSERIAKSSQGKSISSEYQHLHSKWNKLDGKSFSVIG